MQIRVPLEAGAGAPWRCEETRFSAVAAHPLLGQPLLALNQHEEVTCTRRVRAWSDLCAGLMCHGP